MIEKARRTVKKLRTSKLVRRVGLLSMGVAVGQIVTLAASPVLARLFDPPTFGLFGMFSSITFVVGNISAGRYDLGIVLTKGRSMAAALWALSLLATVTVAVFFGVFLLLGGGSFLTSLMGTPALMQVLPWAPLQILSIGLFLAAGQWATRRQHFRSQAEYQITRAIVVAALQISAGAMALGVDGLVVAQIVGSFLAVAVLLQRSVARDWPTLRRGFSRRRLVAAARRHRGMPLYAAPQDFVTAVTQNLPYVILGRNFDPIVVGYFWLTVRTLQLPVNFLGQALRNVLLQHVAARVQARDRLTGDYMRTTAALLLLGAILFAPVILFGPELFSLVFGEKWATSGHYAQWVALWMQTSIAKIPSWCILHVYRRQRLLLVFEGVLLLCQLAALNFFAARGDPVLAIEAYVLTYVALNACMMLAGVGIAWSEDERTTG